VNQVAGLMPNQLDPDVGQALSDEVQAVIDLLS